MNSPIPTLDAPRPKVFQFCAMQVNRTSRNYCSGFVKFGDDLTTREGQNLLRTLIGQQMDPPRGHDEYVLLSLNIVA